MTTFAKYILPALLISLGAILGVFLTSSFNHDEWQKRVSYEEHSKLFEEKLKLIERTTAIFAKIPAADDLFSNYFKLLLDTTKSESKEKNVQIELAQQLANIRSELWTVLLLDQMYFGDSTRAKISVIIDRDKQTTWWKIPEKQYNEITETMASELLKNSITSEGSGSYQLKSPMSDTSKILWTAIATLIGGIIIYVFGRTIEKFVLEPLQEYKRTIANISDALIFYANIYSNANVATKDDKTETSKAIRKLSSDLSAKTNQIVFYKIFEKLEFIPSYINSMDAATNLMGFSNSMWSAEYEIIEARRLKIAKLLKIRI